MLPDRGWMGGAAGWEDGAGTLGWTRQAAKPPPPPHYSLSTCSYTRPADQAQHIEDPLHTTHYTHNTAIFTLCNIILLHSHFILSYFIKRKL